MKIDPDELSPKEKYLLTIASVIPRPIGWTSTINEAGEANLAPFSFFNAVSTDPPTMMLSVGRKKGARKDTANNLLATKEAVLHITHRPLAESMVQSAADVPPSVDEFELASLEKIASELVKPPRIASAAIAMEAKVVHHQEVGNGPVDMFLLEVLRFHLDDRFLVDGRPDAKLLSAVGRLGGPDYCDTSEVFSIARPGR